MNDPFQGLLADLLKMIGGATASPTAWLDAARSLAQGVATDGQPEENADPLVRIRLEELGRVAELHVADATGLPLDRATTLVPVGRGAWALRTLDAWAPTLARVVEAQRGAAGGSSAGGTASGGPMPHPPGADGTERSGTPPGLDRWGGDVPRPFGMDEGFEELIGRFATTMGPVLVGMQFGSAAGHLAQRALGQYALPLPWPVSAEVLIVPDNVARFAGDWSLPPDEARLWVCVRELAAHVVLSQPHVASRIRGLVDVVTAEMVATQQGLAERIGGEAGDPEALQRILSDPESLLADLLTPGQRRTSDELVAVTTVVAAYVDHVTGRVTGTLTGAAGALSEAWYRYQIEESSSVQAAGALFGLDLSREQVDRGAAFVRGVVDRAGEDGLARLWDDPRHLPTPAEVDAPGLWLERIDLPELPGG